jgi:hypothetical protein
MACMISVQYGLHLGGGLVTEARRQVHTICDAPEESNNIPHPYVRLSSKVDPDGKIRETRTPLKQLQ